MDEKRFDDMKRTFAALRTRRVFFGMVAALVFPPLVLFQQGTSEE